MAQGQPNTNFMSFERIDASPAFDGHIRESHEYRYKVAARYVRPTDIVVDAACGTGYAKPILKAARYVGIDKVALGADIVADLETWEPDFDFDVFVSVETIEHLFDWKHLLAMGRRAKRVMIISTPIIPSTMSNEFHVQNFTFAQITKELVRDGWKLVHCEEQEYTYGIWVLDK